MRPVGYPFPQNRPWTKAVKCSFQDPVPHLVAAKYCSAEIGLGNTFGRGQSDQIDDQPRFEFMNG